MKIHNQQNITFKSKLIFVSPNTYHEVCKNISKSLHYENIQVWDVCPEYFEKTWRLSKVWLGWRKNMEKGFTDGVRSCTAGIAVDKGKPAPFFWHIEDDSDNNEHLKKLKDFIKGTNAIIVGSKSYFLHSTAIFEKFKKYTKSKNLPTTIMQDLKMYWQANLAYDSKDDTLYLCVNNINTDEYVDSRQKLDEVFRKVKISEADEVEFPSNIAQFVLSNKDFP